MSSKNSSHEDLPVFISYAWGYTTDVSTAIRYGSFIFELPVLQVYTVNDPLFVWVDTQMEYELTFKSAAEPDMHYLIIILISSVFFCNKNHNIVF